MEHWHNIKHPPKPFYCQIEAAETLIWLNEAAHRTTTGKKILTELTRASNEFNQGIFRLACKMATGTGKTTVMAMLIAYHTINKMHRPSSTRHAKKFLIITPGVTIKDRLRVLHPSFNDNSYVKGNILPDEFRPLINHAKVAISNYHAFQPRDKIKVKRIAKQVLGIPKDTDLFKEGDHEVIDRICGAGPSDDNYIIINDEAHHCYVSKHEARASQCSEEEREEISQNNKTARVWVKGIAKLRKSRNVIGTYDLSATPFFLSGSGYPSGRLFPWAVSDFALIDAIESGITKMPRVPMRDDTVEEGDMPIYRDIYAHVKDELPKTSDESTESEGHMDPSRLPTQLLGALEALYDNYEKTFRKWEEKNVRVPPVFIVVCNNTATSRLVFEYIAGYERKGTIFKGKLPLFSNVGQDNQFISKMNTLLVDSKQLDSGEQITDEFKSAAAEKILGLKRHYRNYYPDKDIENPTDAILLREMMNSVGKHDEIGEHIRCVVSVAMLSEGWDAKNVTHILGIRAFSSQLLCEQVVGRGLRRTGFDIDTNDKSARLRPEYADIFGVPFAFVAEQTTTEPTTPPDYTDVFAVEDRVRHEITFPRVKSYTVHLENECFQASFTEDSYRHVSPEDAPLSTLLQAVIGETSEATLEDLKKRRIGTLAFQIATEVAAKFQSGTQVMSPSKFISLLSITKTWLNRYLICKGNTFPQYLYFRPLRDKAVEAIFNACIPAKAAVKAFPVLDSYKPRGTTKDVRFQTTKPLVKDTDEDSCHINRMVCDSGWEMKLGDILERHAKVKRYVRNERLGFEIPYEHKHQVHNYWPDFIAHVSIADNPLSLLNLIIEVKGLKDEQSTAKADTAIKQWVPAVNNRKKYGRWGFLEVREPSMFERDLNAYIESAARRLPRL